MTALATFVRRERDSRGLTQKGLASAAGVTQAAISDIERGQTKLPNADIRRRLAQALGVSHVDLLIAAGELTADELEAAGVAGVVEREADPYASRVCGALEELGTLRQDEADVLLRMIAIMRQERRGKR